MRSLCKAGLTIAVLALVVSPALAQRQGRGAGGGGFGGGAMLLQNPSVQKELKLSEEQLTKIKDAGTKLREDLKDDFDKLRSRDTKPEERTEIMKKVGDASKKAMDGILTADQKKRLKQIELQQAGLQAMLTDEDVQKQLKLTDDQKEKIKTISEDLRKDMQDLRQNAGGNPQEAFQKFGQLRKEAQEKAVAVLSADQKKTWKEMTGEPFEIKIEAGRGRGRPPVR